MQRSKWQTIGMLLLTVFLQGCVYGYEAPQEKSEFGRIGYSNVLNTTDGRTGVFLAHRLVYRTQVRLAPGDGTGKYFVDRWLIGTYDLKSGQIKILHKLNKRGELSASYSDMSLLEIKGDQVLITGLADRQGYKPKFSYGLLNINSGKLIQLPIEAEIVEQKFSLGSAPRLLNEAGTLALLTSELYKDGFESASDLWIRRPNGEYNRMDTVIHFYGYRNNEVHFYSVSNKYRIYNLKTRIYRQGTHHELRLLGDEKRNEENERLKSLIGYLGTCYENGSNRLCIGRKQKEDWEYEILPITVKQLDQY